MDDDGGCVVIDGLGGNLVDSRCKMKMKFLDLVYVVVIIFVIVFGLFVAYQLIRKLLGGSWDVESLFLGLLMTNVGLVFTIAVSQIRLGAEFKFFQKQFGGLVNDLRRKNII